MFPAVERTVPQTLIGVALAEIAEIAGTLAAPHRHGTGSDPGAPQQARRCARLMTRRRQLVPTDLARTNRARRLEQSFLRLNHPRPHPEERPAGPRLEGWEPVLPLPMLRDATLRVAPQHEVGFGSHHGSIASYRIMDGNRA